MSWVRSTTALCMAVAGLLLLSGGAGFGPCGGSNPAWNPPPSVGFLVMVIGLETLVGSYFLAKQNRSEGNFRMLVYFVLFSTSIGVIAPIVWTPRSITTADFYFISLGLVATVNLVLFWKRVGVASAPRNLDPDNESVNTFTKSLLFWEASVLGPAILVLISRQVEVSDPLEFAIWIFALGLGCVALVFASMKVARASSVAFAAATGAGIMIFGGLIISEVFGGFEGSIAAWGLGLVLSVPSAIACGVISNRLKQAYPTPQP